MTAQVATDPQGALAGLRVVELGTMLAAPLTGMLLADHGADVIKVEMPSTGDQLRGWGRLKEDKGLFWKVIGRNKRTVTLDLHEEADRTRLRSILAEADILIENFRPGTLERWDLSPASLQESNPRLIVLRVSGWGQDGPYARRPGFGTLVEAFSGFAFINGWDDRPPTLPPFGLADSMAGFIGAFGVMAAVEARHRTGVGQVIDLALYEPMLTSLGSSVIDYDQLSVVQTRAGNRTPFTAPRNAYQCRDGKWMALSGSSQSTAMRLLQVLGGEDLCADPRFADNQSRMAHYDELDKLIAAWTSEADRASVLATLQSADVPACAVNSVADLLADEHVVQRESVISVLDDDWGQVRVPAPIPRMSGTPASVRHLGKSLGEDNDSVLDQEPW